MVKLCHLGYRDIEPVADSLDDRAAHLPFPLQTVVVWKMEVELAGANDHRIRIRLGFAPAYGLSKVLL
jgi:hypothetical protein